MKQSFKTLSKVYLWENWDFLSKASLDIILSFVIFNLGSYLLNRIQIWTLTCQSLVCNSHYCFFYTDLNCVLDYLLDNKSQDQWVDSKYLNVSLFILSTLHFCIYQSPTPSVEKQRPNQNEISKMHYFSTMLYRRDDALCQILFSISFPRPLLLIINRKFKFGFVCPINFTSTAHWSVFCILWQI